MVKTCSWPNCDKTSGGKKELGWMCKQHRDKDLSAWMETLTLDQEVRQELLALVSNLTELRDVEESDVAELTLSKIAERKLRRALVKLGNPNVKATGPRDSAVQAAPQSFSSKTNAKAAPQSPEMYNTVASSVPNAPVAAQPAAAAGGSPAVQQAVALKMLKLEGVGPGEARYTAMGVYDLIEGKLVNGRGVWQARNGADWFLFYAKRQHAEDQRWHWWVGSREKQAPRQLGGVPDHRKV